MKKLKHALVLSVMIGALSILPAAFNQAGAAETPSDSVLVLAQVGAGSGFGASSGIGSVTSSAPDKQAPSQNQTQTNERVEARENAPDQVNVREANRVMENARDTLKQIREQSGNQALAEEKWQDLRGQISQVKEQYKLRQVTREEAKVMVRDYLELAREQQNLEGQENCLEDLVEIEPADEEAYKELGAVYRMKGQQGIKVFSNGVGIKFDVPPVIKDGRTLIPVRALTEGFGATVNYDAENQTVTVTKGETAIVLTIGQNVALVNGQEVTLDAKAELNNSRTIVPLRFISETFKLNVDYYPDGEIVTVNNTGSTGSSTETSTGTTTGGVVTEGSTTPITTTPDTGTNPQ
ncbi:MAG: copper amine oxidase N-terminal domain-containing protein [Eubacteriales bacterium]